MSTPSDINISAYRQSLDDVRKTLNKIILGKPVQVDLAICCLFAKGHLLIEDLPGVGKTTMALALARVFDLDFQRIQFTSDLLPADILGVSIFDSQTQHFNFHKGAVFSQCLLADEINRTTPKTQSALLEAMEEYQVSVDGDTHKLPEPFYVVATQNPLDQSGTYPLPESQLDRFMMRIELGYPDQEAEMNLYLGASARELIHSIKPVMSSDLVREIQSVCQKIHVSEPLVKYVQTLINATRQSHLFIYGLSPRAGLAIVQASKSWAFLHYRNYVEPDDVKLVFHAIAAHRLIPLEENSKGAAGILSKILEETAIP